MFDALSSPFIGAGYSRLPRAPGDEQSSARSRPIILECQPKHTDCWVADMLTIKGLSIAGQAGDTAELPRRHALYCTSAVVSASFFEDKE